MIHLVVTAFVATAASGFDCGKFTHMKRLPSSFEETSSAEGVGWEFFTLTDHVCSCDNTPSIERRHGKTVPDGTFWMCRPANDEERRKE